MYMMMFVLDDPNKLDEVLEAWAALGVSGTTITESTGYYRRRRAKRIGARYLFGAQPVAENAGQGQFTLFVIVPDEDTVHRCTEAAEKITGDLSQPNTGVVAAWPLTVAKGVPDELGEIKETDE